VKRGGEGSGAGGCGSVGGLIASECGGGEGAPTPVGEVSHSSVETQVKSV